jgi:uncharacterized Zn finger protein (UPF0148 family)
MSEFGTLNLEDFAAEGQRLSSEGGKRDALFISIPKPKPGGTTVFPVRILPPAKGAKLFQYTRLHMVKGHSVHCPKPLVNGRWDKDTPCPICTYYNSLYRKADQLEDQGRKAEADKLREEARQIKPIERYYYNAVARAEVDEKGEKHTNVGPKILSVGKVLHKMVVRAIVGDETEPALGDVTNVKNGYDFLIKMEIRGTGKDGFPNYDRTSFAREASPAGTPEEIKKWVENLNNLADLRKPAAVEDLERELARHRGLIDDEEEGFDVDAFDAKYSSGRKPSSVPVSDEDAVGSVVSSVVGTDADVEETVTPSAPAEDVTIEDEQFLKELRGLGDE